MELEKTLREYLVEENVGSAVDIVAFYSAESGETLEPVVKPDIDAINQVPDEVTEVLHEETGITRSYSLDDFVFIPHGEISLSEVYDIAIMFYKSGDYDVTDQRDGVNFKSGENTAYVLVSPLTKGNFVVREERNIITKEDGTISTHLSDHAVTETIRGPSRLPLLKEYLGDDFDTELGAIAKRWFYLAESTLGESGMAEAYCYTFFHIFRTALPIYLEGGDLESSKYEGLWVPKELEADSVMLADFVDRALPMIGDAIEFITGSYPNALLEGTATKKLVCAHALGYGLDIKSSEKMCADELSALFS